MAKNTLLYQGELSIPILITYAPG